MMLTAEAPVSIRPYDGGQLRFDHLELWVGNAKQAAEYYITALGFRPLAYAGPETGLADRASYVVAQGAIRLVLTSALRPGGPINDHVARQRSPRPHRRSHECRRNADAHRRHYDEL